MGYKLHRRVSVILYCTVVKEDDLGLIKGSVLDTSNHQTDVVTLTKYDFACA